MSWVLEHMRANAMRDAAGLMAWRGYDNVRAEELARVARISVGTLYRHYGSKQGFAREVRRFTEQLLSQVAWDGYSRASLGDEPDYRCAFSAFWRKKRSGGRWPCAKLTGHGVAAVLTAEARSLKAPCRAAPRTPPRLSPRGRCWPVPWMRRSFRLQPPVAPRWRWHPPKRHRRGLAWLEKRNPRAGWLVELRSTPGAPRWRRHPPKRHRRALARL